MLGNGSGFLLLAGLMVAGFGLVAFNRAHQDRPTGGGLGSGLTPYGREALSIVVILTGLGLMFAAAIGY